MAFTPNFDTLIKAAGEGHGGLEFLSQVSTVTLGPCIFSVDLCRWLVLEFFIIFQLTSCYIILFK